MNDAGVFGRFVPDFGRVVAQMQYDMYHVYTVDEHTIRAIGILSRIERGALKDEHPAATAAFGEIRSRRALYVAVLLHDIAKGRGGDHSEIGAQLALTLCPRFGLDDWETETVSWLVRYHLLLSRYAFKRDIDDAKTVSDLTGLVQSPERLRMLMILTNADIRAVGPNIWNAWKRGLLDKLYYRALEDIEMTGGQPAERRAARVEHAKAKLRARLGRVAGKRARNLHRPRLFRLLARLLGRGAGKPLRDDAGGRPAGPRAMGGGAPASGAGRHRDHHLCPRPSRAVRPDCRRHRPIRRLHRRCQGGDAGQLDGA